MDSTKQHLPVFVGSTFEDLQDYRQAVRESLHRLEAIVRGMEYFGSKPGSPLEECLAVAGNCRMYIGVFAMRYGSKPDGHDLSMTHLEYEEAQRLKLPSLIYILDEKRQPILPPYVETGPGAEQLKRLKDLLCKRHTVSFFTTTDDLASRVFRDVPPVLQTIGAEVTGNLSEEPVAGENEVDEIIRKFKLLPKRLVGTEIAFELEAPDKWVHVAPEICVALRIAEGESIYRVLSLGETNIDIYASGEIAEELIRAPAGQTMALRARLAYGTTTASYSDPEGGGYIKEVRELFGIVVTHLKAPS